MYIDIRVLIYIFVYWHTYSVIFIYFHMQYYVYTDTYIPLHRENKGCMLFLQTSYSDLDVLLEPDRHGLVTSSKIWLCIWQPWTRPAWIAYLGFSKERRKKGTLNKPPLTGDSEPDFIRRRLPRNGSAPHANIFWQYAWSDHSAGVLRYWTSCDIIQETSGSSVLVLAVGIEVTLTVASAFCLIHNSI